MQKKQGFGIDALRIWAAQAGFNVGVTISDSALSDLSDKLFKVRLYSRAAKVLQIQIRNLDFSSEKPWGFSSDVSTILSQRMPSWIFRSSNDCTKTTDTCSIFCMVLGKRWVTSDAWIRFCVILQRGIFTADDKILRGFQLFPGCQTLKQFQCLKCVSFLFPHAERQVRIISQLIPVYF